MDVRRENIEKDRKKNKFLFYQLYLRINGK